MGYAALRATMQGLLMRRIHQKHVENKARLLIEKFGATFRTKFRMMGVAAGLIQAQFRGVMLSKLFAKKKRSAQLIQTWWRGCMNKRQLQEAMQEQVWSRFNAGTIFVSLIQHKPGDTPPAHGVTHGMKTEAGEEVLKKLFAKDFGRVLSVVIRQRATLNDWALVTFAHSDSRDRSLKGPLKHGQSEWGRKYQCWLMEVDMRRARDSTGDISQLPFYCITTLVLACAPTSQIPMTCSLGFTSPERSFRTFWTDVYHCQAEGCGGGQEARGAKAEEAGSAAGPRHRISTAHYRGQGGLSANI